MGTTPTGSSLWTPKLLDNGKWALKGENGKYLGRCHDCAIGARYPDTTFAEFNEDDPAAQWTVVAK